MHDVNKWALDKFPTLPGHKIKAPMIDGSVLNAECRVVATHQLGHTLYIAETIWARFDPDKAPLLYHDGKYWRMGEQVPKG